jgi:hypothetical protein
MELHWIITLQFTAGRAVTTWTSDGTHTLRPGETRAGVYRQVFHGALRAAAEKGFPGARNGGSPVLFFSLEPSQFAA